VTLVIKELVKIWKKSIEDNVTYYLGM